MNPGAVKCNLFVDEPAPELIDKLAQDDDQEDVLEVQEEVSDSEEGKRKKSSDLPLEKPLDLPGINYFVSS